ncbi:efflux transporter outer membrane subunit [Brucella pituitosa]|uniref:Efflux transporter outer membrane subunit n=1 Tax=Brucella pituitosa TaxID=571256 RepID=A0ABS3K2N6_9HYPH|nr:efflux transporter outer membrane subunit [Brucella pituitosa]MBO1041185.1 efflux transporter outer membrane subunit [Brucella pituitosa]
MTKHLARLTVLTSFLPLVAACVAVGPDYQKPTVITPKSWNSNANTRAPVLAEWWNNLNDPVLNQLITEGISGSPDVATAKAKIRQARANFTSAGGVLYPSLDGAGSYTRSDNGLSTASSQSSFQFKTQWELDLFGGNRRGVEAAYYNVESANEQLRAALVTLIGDIATNYAQLRGAQADIAIAQRNSASQERTVTLTRSQLEAGQISQVDLLSAQTQAANTESQIPGLRIRYASYLNNLTVLTGRSAIALAASLDKSGPVPNVPRNVSAGLPADVLFNRPDLRAAERDYASSTASIGQKQAGLYPSISLTGNISTGGTSLGDLAKLSTIGWSFGPTLSMPIFNGGKLNADVDAAKAARDQSFTAYRKAILTALSEVENASVSLNQNRVRAAQLQKIVVNSRKINELTLEQFKAGNKSFIEVLNAQRDVLNSETSLNQVRTDLVVNYIALQKALGGGWSGQVDVNKPEVVDGYTGPHIVKSFIPASPAISVRRP